MKKCTNNWIHRTEGFTLLEVLVVLMLISLVTALLMQGLGLIFHIRQNIRNTLLADKPLILQHTFLRSTLSAMTADDINGKHRFTGTAQEITGLTLAPLLSLQGIPLPVELSIKRQEDSCLLRYSESGSTPIILGRWPHSRCRFSYLTEHGKEQDEWSGAGDKAIQLPTAIAFQVENKAGDTFFFLFASITGRRLARTYAPEYFNADSI